MKEHHKEIALFTGICLALCFLGLSENKQKRKSHSEYNTTMQKIIIEKEDTLTSSNPLEIYNDITDTVIVHKLNNNS